MTDVFISYSRKDIAFARLIRESLQQSEIDTWIDWDRIPIGEKWWNEICGAIQAANTFVFIVSQNSVGSSVCKDEINLALANHKRIIPIVVDDLKPEVIREFIPDLPQFNWIVFEKDHIFQLAENPVASAERPEDCQVALPKLPQFEQALRKLSTAIHTDWEWVKAHTNLQVDALRWDQNQRGLSYLLRGEELEDAERLLLRGSGKEPQPTGLQIEFVTASRQEETHRQHERLRLEQKARGRQRRVIWAVGIGLVVAVVLGGLAWNQRNQYLSETHVRATAQGVAEEQRNLASTAQVVAVDQRNMASTAQVVAEDQRNVAVEQKNIAISRQLAVQAINQYDYSLGLLLSLEAYQHADTMDARSSLLRLIQSEPQLRYFINSREYYNNGHTGSVWNVAISPDGKTIASASADATIGLWDLATGRTVHPALTGHSKGVRTVAFSPDGRYLVSGGEDGQIILWDGSQDFSSTILFSKLGAWVYNLVFSRDGKYLAASFTDRSVVLWSMPGRNVACPWLNGQTESQEFTVLAFSPDSHSLAVGNDGSDQGKLTIWDPVTCQPKGEAIDTARLAKITGAGNSGEVTSLAYSPDGAQLAIGETDHLLVLDAATRQPLREPAVIHSKYRIQSIAYSPDSRTLALGLDDKTIVLLDAASGQPIGQPWVGQRAAIRSVTFSSDGRTLASGGMDANVLVWDLNNHPLNAPLTDQATGVAFSPDGKLMASASSSKGQINLWDTATWQGNAPPLIDPTGGVVALAFSPDGHILAAAGADQLVHLWDPVSGQPIPMQPSGPGANITCLAFSPNGKWLAVGGANNLLTIWDMATRSLYKNLQYDLMNTHDPSGIDIDTTKTIRNVGFSPDSAILYFSMGGGITQLIDMAGFASGNPSVRQLKWTQFAADNYIFSTMSPEGRLIALANALDIRLYDTASLQMVGIPMYGHTNTVAALAFSPDGKLLASTSADGTIRLWDPTTSQPVGLPFTGNSQGGPPPVFSPDGKWLASISADSRVVVWDISIAGWISLACQHVRRNLSDAEWQQFLPDEAYHLTCPDQPIAQSGASQLTALARKLLGQGKTEEAKTMIREGLHWILPIKDHGADNSLCWFGSLDGFAAEVLQACEDAVLLAPASQAAGNRDSRGLALALTGKTDRAIEDFQAFVDWSKQNGVYDTDGRKREEWIAALKSGQNPLDKQLLQSLRNP
jgi:WD40 repeat protein